MTVELGKWLKSASLLILLSGLLAAPATAFDPPPDVTGQTRRLLAEANLPWSVYDVIFTQQTLAVCLAIPPETLLADGGLEAEAVQSTVQRALAPLDWRV